MTTEPSKRSSERIEAAAEKVETAAGTVQSASHSTWRSVKWLYPIVFVLGIIVIGLSVIVYRMDGNVDDIEGQGRVTGQQVAEVKDFVDELRVPPTAEQRAQDEAIARAVALVPSIREILCDPLAFGEVRGCQVVP